ncbi:MAG: endonuclease/exonuclease/phosphatase family protein, partial [Chloroflexota bacterium]
GSGLPLLLLRRESFSLEKTENANFTPRVLGSLALLSIAAFYLTAAKPVAPQGTTSLKIMTYNIQQGVDAEGNRNLDGQLAVIKSVDPDILGLEEWETTRVANGNIDAVRYFADKLDMYAYYGPTVTTGTFGVALLSKYPIQNPETFFMYSTGEQTATIHAEIVKGDKTYHVFVTHLGNGGPIFQLEQMLTRIRGLDNVITMGDFNFEPATDQYALMTQTLDDSWLLKWQGGKEIPGLPSDERIDHIFTSPGTSVLESEYGTSPASDHPYLYTAIEP